MPTEPALYTLTFDELKARAAQGETLVSHSGYLIHSRDRKFDEKYAYYIWSADIDLALHEGRLRPEDNPKKEKSVTDSRPRNAKGKPFSWSHSALQDFEGCPLRYAGQKFYCDTPFVETEAIIWGNRVHKAAEIYVRDGKETDPEAFKEVEKYAKLFRSAKAQAEVEIVLDQDMKPLTGSKAWSSSEAWYRGKLDVVLTQGSAAKYWDYKTGKTVKDDAEQLETCLAALAVKVPGLEQFSGKLIWTRHQEITGGVELDRAGVARIWADRLARVERMVQAWKSENFPARPSGLCPWCAKYETCKDARRR